MKKMKFLFLPILLLAMLAATSSSASATTLISGWNISNASGFGLPEGSITTIVLNILDWLLMLFGVIGILGFVISGIMYILAAGDEDVMERAKNAMKWSIIGVIVGLAGFVAIQAIDAALNAGYSVAI